MGGSIFPTERQLSCMQACMDEQSPHEFAIPRHFAVVVSASCA